MSSGSRLVASASPMGFGGVPLHDHGNGWFACRDHGAGRGDRRVRTSRRWRYASRRTCWRPPKRTSRSPTARSGARHPGAARSGRRRRPAGWFGRRRSGRDAPRARGGVRLPRPRGRWSQATHCCWVEVDVETGAPRSPAASSSRTAARSSIGRSSTGRSAARRTGNRRGVLERTRTTTTPDSSSPRRSPTISCPRLRPARRRDRAPPTRAIPPGEIPFRGVGEGGFLGAPGAPTKAVADVPAALGVQITEQHLPPLRGTSADRASSRRASERALRRRRRSNRGIRCADDEVDQRVFRQLGASPQVGVVHLGTEDRR